MKLNEVPRGLVPCPGVTNGYTWRGMDRNGRAKPECRFGSAICILGLRPITKTREEKPILAHGAASSSSPRRRWLERRGWAKKMPKTTKRTHYAVRNQ